MRADIDYYIGGQIMGLIKTHKSPSCYNITCGNFSCPDCPIDGMPFEKRIEWSRNIMDELNGKVAIVTEAKWKLA